LLQAELREEILCLQEEFDAATTVSKLVVKPFRDLLKEHKKMREIINVTIVEIELEELDDATVAFVKAQVEEQVLRVIVTESVQSNGKKCPSYATFPKEGDYNGINVIDCLRKLQVQNVLEMEDMKNVLNSSKKKIKELEEKLESSQRNHAILLSDSTKKDEKIQELESEVIRFCKVQYCLND
jgi:ferritin